MINNNYTNILLFIGILFILITLFFYTAHTKESFFVTSDLPNGTIVILDGKAENDNGFFIYTNQIPNSCTDNCKPSLVALNNMCNFQTQPDGNMVIYDSYNNAVWASGTQGQGSAPYRSVMQPDGNFVLYDSSNQATWASNTSSPNKPFKLIMQNDCNLVAYDKNNNPLWSSGTQGQGKNPPLNPKTNLNWSQIQGELFSVSLAPNGDIWGTDSQGNIYHKTNANLNFNKIKGELKNIDTDGLYVCGTNNKNEIFCANYNDALIGAWNKIGKNQAKSISVSNKSAYIINLDNSISYTIDITDPLNVKWQQVPIVFIQFHSISLDNSILVGINNKNELYFADEKVFSKKPTFIKMKTLPEMQNFVHISLQNKTVLVTDTSGQLWYASNYKIPNWIKLDTKGKTFMASQILN
jgi:hypothetical protein